MNIIIEKLSNPVLNYESQFSEMRKSKNFPDAPASDVVSTLPLREYELFAITKNGDVANLGITCSFFQFGAERVAERIVKNMTHVERTLIRITAKAQVFAVERVL